MNSDIDRQTNPQADLPQETSLGYDDGEVREIIHEFYNVLLGREPDPSGAEIHIQALCRDKSELLAVFRGIAFSEESRLRRETSVTQVELMPVEFSEVLPSGLDELNIRQVIEQLFQAFLGRNPEEQAIETFQTALLGRGLSLVSMIEELANAEERKALLSLPLNQSTTIDPSSSRAKLLALYFTGEELSAEAAQNLLKDKEGECPTVAELVSSAFARPRALSRLMELSQRSPERLLPSGVDELNVRKVIEQLFQAFLGRDPEEQAIETFQTALLSQGLSLVSMIEELANAEERQALLSLPLNQSTTIDPSSNRAKLLALYFTGEELSAEEAQDLLKDKDGESPTVAELVSSAFARPRALHRLMELSQRSPERFRLLVEALLDSGHLGTALVTQIVAPKSEANVSAGLDEQLRPLMGSAARAALVNLLVPNSRD